MFTDNNFPVHKMLAFVPHRSSREEVGVEDGCTKRRTLAPEMRFRVQHVVRFMLLKHLVGKEQIMVLVKCRKNKHFLSHTFFLL